MYDLTLVIPAKKEGESLPRVIEELREYNLKKLIVLEKNDLETINSISDDFSKIIYQTDKGYGDALIQGINHVKTKYFCIFNADGSFDPKELKNMFKRIELHQADILFASRYESGSGSEDDTFITRLGNFIFTKIGNIFFKLEITDILYTYVMGNTDKVKKIDLQSKDFGFCVELPIKAARMNYKLITSKSFERARISGKKKVSAFRDGTKILIKMLNLYFY